MSHTIHQEITFSASVEHIFSAYMDEKSHAEFTGAPATLDPSNGGAFSVHNGMVEGRNIEVVENKRIVQAWRVSEWPEGMYSLIKIEFIDNDGACTLVLDHSSFPEDAGEHLDSGWHKMYWEPLKTWLEK